MTQPTRVVPLRFLVLIALLTLWNVASAAPTPPRGKLALPADIVLETSSGKDAAVTFRHSTHAAFTGVRCVTCHPALFRMLKPERSFTHEKMDAGQQCGVCHEGKQAFSTAAEDRCGRCHPGLGADPGYPPDVPLQGSGGSPAPVLFRHSTHAAIGSCADCHPAPYLTRAARSATGAAPAGGHETCVACHDGSLAFGVEQEASCERCHAPGSGSKGNATGGAR